MKNTIYASLYLILAIIAAGCQSQDKTLNHEHTAHASYTCPMHPHVVSESPGACPVCGMDLVVKDKLKSAHEGIMLNDAQLKLANIKIGKVNMKLFGQSTLINGTLAIDKEKSEVISSRVPGRIDRLYIKENGQHIAKGAPLYTLYSEELLTLKQEYLLAREQYEKLTENKERYRSFLKAAEGKLKLYGMSAGQIATIRQGTSLQSGITFHSPVSGIITEISVTEGQYVGEGTILFRIENLETLWVEAELFPEETTHVDIGDVISATINGSTDEPIDATVTFLGPELRANTQIITMRASIKNPAYRFRPGQQVSIQLSHSKKQALTVPLDAVIRSEKGAHLYVLTGTNTFEPRRVTTGPENHREIEITEGLQVGDSIAVSGAYLLYSEMILKKGTDPATSHAH